MSIDPLQNGEWREYRRLVVSEIKRLSDKNDGQDLAIYKLEKEFLFLKVKSGLWGFLAGCVPSLVVVILYLVFKR